jgi:hypothetical protein
MIRHLRGFGVLGCVLFASAVVLAQGSPPTPPDEAKQPAATQPKSFKFPDGEKALAAAVADWVANFPKRPLPTVMKSYLLGPDWGMERTPAGVIVGRVIQAVIFVRGGESGRCTQRLCNLRQEEHGGKWSKPFLQCLEQYSTRFSCKSIEALKL